MNWFLLAYSLGFLKFGLMILFGFFDARPFITKHEPPVFITPEVTAAVGAAVFKTRIASALLGALFWPLLLLKNPPELLKAFVDIKVFVYIKKRYWDAQPDREEDESTSSE